MKRFTIGKLAGESGVGVETVRFYERKGLIKKPIVTQGYRKYPEEDANRIRFIRRAQGLGFTLKEIKGLVELNSSPRSTCSDVRRRTDAKLTEVDEKIRDLKMMRKSLGILSRACGDSREALAHRQILECFEPGWKCE